MGDIENQLKTLQKKEKQMEEIKSDIENQLETLQKKEKQMAETKLDIEEDPVQNKKRVSCNCLYLIFSVTVGILIILLGLSLAYVEWNPTEKEAQIQENILLNKDKNNLQTQNEALRKKNETDNEELKVTNAQLHNRINATLKENTALKEEQADIKIENTALKEEQADMK